MKEGVPEWEVGCDLFLGEGWSRINEAGVAGHICWPSDMDWDGPLLLIARIEGDAVTEAGRGGGAISASDKGSGDIDSASEPSRLGGIPRPAEAGRD